MVDTHRENRQKSEALPRGNENRTKRGDATDREQSPGS
jgi:hypothetical protein